MRAIINILTYSILSFSCKEIDKKDTSNLTSADSLTTHKVEKKKTVREVIYKNDNVKIIGNINIDKDDIFYVSMKFEPYITFEDYKVAKYDNLRKAKLNLSSNKSANNFRTILRERYENKESNFAGHYTFVEWGCGVPCRSSLVIDRLTGRIFDSPTASLGYEYKKNSRMLIVNPPDSTGFYDDCSYCKPAIFIFDERTKIFKEVSPAKK